MNETNQKPFNWKKGCLIGCGVSLILMIILAIALVLAIGKLTGYVADKTGHYFQSQMEQRLPQDYNKQHFDEGYQKGYDAIKEGKISWAEAKELGLYANEILADGKLTAEELDSFFKRVEAAAQSDATIQTRMPGIAFGALPA